MLSVSGQPGCVVLEMTDSPRSGWGAYLDEAERNRDAAASIGVVRTTDQNAGQSIRVLGSRRVVIAFNPDEDDPELLRTVVMLLRTVAITASLRTGSAEVETAEEKIAEALTQLEKIDAVKKIAGTIQKGAAKIDSECTSISTSIQRLLDQALAALAGGEAEHRKRRSSGCCRGCVISSGWRASVPTCQSEQGAVRHWLSSLFLVCSPLQIRISKTASDLRKRGGRYWV